MLPISGVWGGPTPDGASILAHFHIDYKSLPNIINMAPDEKGYYDPNSGEQISRADYTREIQTSLFMTPEVAITVGKWLQNMGETLMGDKE